MAVVVPLVFTPSRQRLTILAQRRAILTSLGSQAHVLQPCYCNSSGAKPDGRIGPTGKIQFGAGKNLFSGPFASRGHAAHAVKTVTHPLMAIKVINAKS